MAYYYNIRWGPALFGNSTVARHGPRPFRVRAPHALGLVVRVTHVSASRSDHALAIRQHEENPRTQTRVALRVQGGPWPVWPQPLGSGRILPSIEAAGAQPPEHPGRQFTHTGASRGLTLLLRRRGHRARLPRARLRATGTWGGHRCCPGRPHTRQSASRRRAETTCWNTRLHTLPGLLSQPGRTRHRRCFHRGPVNRGCAHRRLGSAPYPNARRNSMDRNSGDCSPERPRHGSLDGPRRGQAHAAVPQVHAEGL